MLFAMTYKTEDGKVWPDQVVTDDIPYVIDGDEIRLDLPADGTMSVGALLIGDGTTYVSDPGMFGTTFKRMGWDRITPPEGLQTEDYTMTYGDGFGGEGELGVQVGIDGQDIYARSVNVDELRKDVGMVFQRPNPFPKSIYENVAYGLRVNGVKDENFIAERVERSLRGAALWDEVKDKLKKSAYALSGGQQQRLCIARAMAVSPSVLLMDEPASALDPISTAKVEELIHELKSEYTIVIVTHNMQQATRVSDKTAFFYLGELIEFDRTNKIFTNPSKEQTQNYITGRFG